MCVCVYAYVVSCVCVRVCVPHMCVCGFAQIFKYYAVTPEGEREAPLPGLSYPPDVINKLSGREARALAAFHNRDDPTNSVRMRFDAFKRFVQGVCGYCVCVFCGNQCNF